MGISWTCSLCGVVFDATNNNLDWVITNDSIKVIHTCKPCYSTAVSAAQNRD